MRKAVFILLAFLFQFNILSAQSDTTGAVVSSSGKNNPLEGLRKAGMDDLDPDQPIMLDGVSIPIYDVDGNRIQGESFMKVMMSGEFVPETYVDHSKAIKAFVLRKATEEDKKQMMHMEEKMPETSEWVGKDAFAFDMTDMSGNRYSLEKLKGKVVVINFWFIECKPCIMEIPELNKLVEKYNKKDVVFLAIANNPKDKLETFLKNTAYKYQIIAGDKNLVEHYGVRYYPTHLIIDRNAKVAYCVNGLGPDTMNQLDETINKLLK